MADVHVTLAVFTGLKALLMVAEQRPMWAVVWALGSVTASRAPWTVVLIAAMDLWVGVPYNHVALLLWTASIVWLTGGDRSTFGVLAISVYGFATLNKLVAGTGLVASHLVTRGGIPVEIAPAVAVAAVLTQTFLVWAVWRRHWTASWVAAGLHAGITITMSHSAADWLAMGLFNGLMVWIVWYLVKLGPDASRIVDSDPRRA